MISMKEAYWVERRRAEKTEAQYEEVCGENAELNDKIREAFDAKWKAEAELAIHEENMPKAYGKILDLKAELAEAKKYDGTREDIRSLQELLDFRTAERDKALDLRDSIERKLLCEVRDLRELLAELLEAYEGQCAMGSECELTAAVRDALAGKGGE